MTTREQPSAVPFTAEDYPGASRVDRAPSLSRAVGGVRVEIEDEAEGSPFEAATDGPAYDAIRTAMQEA